MQCLQYKTDQQTDLRKIEKLNRLLLGLMATGEKPTSTVEVQPAAADDRQAQRPAKGARRKG